MEDMEKILTSTELQSESLGLQIHMNKQNITFFKGKENEEKKEHVVYSCQQKSMICLLLNKVQFFQRGFSPEFIITNTHDLSRIKVGC